LRFLFNENAVNRAIERGENEFLLAGGGIDIPRELRKSAQPFGFVESVSEAGSMR
jgi:hypothetical protein